MIALAFLLAAADPVAQGQAALKQTIVDAIRDCPVAKEGEIAVCAPDRGFAEGQRLPEIKKPEVVHSGPTVTFHVGDAPKRPD